MEFKKGKGENSLEILWRWQKYGLAENRFGEHNHIIKVLKPDTSPGKTELTVRMNATGLRFQCRKYMVSLVGLVDLNRVMEVRASPTAKTKKSKVQISELILRKCTID